MTASRASTRLRYVLAIGAVLAVVAASAPVLAEPAPDPSAPGVCSRTRQVRDQIMAELAMSDCAAVTQADLDRVGSLWITDAGISELQAGDFEGLHGLQQLDLAGNDLVSLPDGVFDGLSNLLLLWLGDNRLRALPDNAFEDLRSLKKLSLQDNRLAWLPDGVFDGLGRLGSLFLQNNRLEELPDGVFDETPNLVDLLLDHNELNSLPDRPFGELSHLRQLSLAHNELTTLPDGAFEGLSSLFSLDMRSNPTEPFMLGMALRLMDQAAVVVIPSGAPFKVVATVSVHGGEESTVEATIKAGYTTSEPISIADQETIRISIESAELHDYVYAHGIQLGIGL